MVAIDLLFYVLSALWAVLGFSFFFVPSSHVLLGYDTSLLVQFLASDYNRTVIVPIWAGAQIALASVTFYATTFTSQHDKAKVARGILFALIAALQANVMDTYAAKQSVFSDPTTMQMLRVGILVVLTLWSFVECFSASEDDAVPTSSAAKKNKHQSTPLPMNNLYLRALSLVWLVQGGVCWFAPSYLSLIGLAGPAPLSSASVFTSFSTTSMGGLLIALATVAGYGATFQSTHNQAKLARSFLLYLALVAGYDGYSLYTGGHGASDTAMWAHVAVGVVFTVWSLIVSFSSTSDDITAGKGKTTVKKQH